MIGKDDELLVIEHSDCTRCPTTHSPKSNFSPGEIETSIGTAVPVIAISSSHPGNGI